MSGETRRSPDPEETARSSSSTSSRRWLSAFGRSTARRWHNVVGLAKAAKTFGIPATITTVETDSFSGHTYPEAARRFPRKR